MQEKVPACVPKFFNSYQTFLIVGHEEPDMDCIGSQLALASFLRNSGKTCITLNAGPFRRKEVQTYATLFTSDLSQVNIQSPSDTAVIILDCSELSRIGDTLAQGIAGMPYLIIDHHTRRNAKLENNDHYIDSAAPATALLIYRIAKIMDYCIVRESALLLFKALATDTGFFRFLPESSSESFAMAAALVDMGVNPQSISEDLEGHNSLSSRKLLAKAIEKAQELAAGKYLISALTNDELQTFNNEKNSDLIYNMLLNTQNCEAIAVVFEDELENCKVSLRSKSTVNVASIARNFGGNGHKQAAGFYVKLPFVQVVEMLKQQFIALDAR